MNAVEFEHVSKSYAIYDSARSRLGELLSLGRKRYHRDFEALKDVSFSVRRGEVFCVVGENGSGKSTALQLMAGIMEPTSGEVRVNGRVAALLELGAGFNKEFSGRDNVYLNGSILGLSQSEMERRYPEIEAFAEIGEFIDQPVKTYSSGMVVRLAFAVAIHVDPEVLLVDEALAVGDTYFRHRCMRKVHELRARGVTIVFVSHAVADVKAIGDRVLWLEHGRAMALGEADEVIEEYLAAMRVREGRYIPPAPEASTPAARAAAPRDTVRPVETLPNIDHRHGDGRASVLGIAILDEFGDAVHLMTPGSRIVVRISLRARILVAKPVVGFLLRNHLGLDFAEERYELAELRAGETTTLDFVMEIPELYPGAFSFSPWVMAGTRSVCDWIDNAITVQMGRGDGPVYGYVQVPCRIELNLHA